MMDTDHVLNQVPDYVLGLLPQARRQQVEQHAAACSECRRAIQRQSQVGQAVRTTLTAATRPDPGRLRQLMPPTRRRRALLPWRLSRPQAVRFAPLLALFFVLLLGSLSPLRIADFGFRNMDPQSAIRNPQSTIETPSPTFLAATATATATATNQPKTTEADFEMRIAYLQSAIRNPQSAIGIPQSAFNLTPTPVAAVYLSSN